MRSIARALSASITLAKSLTGAVSSGRGLEAGWGLAVRAVSNASAIASETTNAERRTPNDERLTSIGPAIDVLHDPLDRVEVRREQTFGVGRRDVVGAGERGDLGD